MAKAIFLASALLWDQLGLINEKNRLLHSDTAEKCTTPINKMLYAPETTFKNTGELKWKTSN